MSLLSELRSAIAIVAVAARFAAAQQADSGVKLPPITIKAAPAAVVWSPLASVRVTRAEILAGDVQWAMKRARALGGIAIHDDQILVDGIPARALPRAEEISEIDINADPFSVRSGAADQNVIEVTSVAPARPFGGGLRHDGGRVGGRNPLAPHLRSQRTQTSASLSGGIPWTTLSASADHSAAHGIDQRPVFILGEPAPGVAVSASRHRTVTGVVAGGRERSSARLTIARTSQDNTGASAGGVVPAQSDASRRGLARDARLTGKWSREWMMIQSGASWTDDRADAVGVATSPSIVVLDALVSGGAEASSSSTRSRRLTWNGAIVRPATAFVAGWSMSHFSDAESSAPNPHGQWLFGSPAEYQRWLNGADAGAFTRAPGVGHRLSGTSGAIFGERAWQLGEHMAVRGGLRGDFLSDDGVRLSPRLAIAAVKGTTILSGGIGLFNEAWANLALLQARGGECFSCARTILVARDDSTTFSRTLRSGISEGFRRPATVVLRQSLSSTWRRVRYGAEYSFTDSRHRPGLRRVLSDAGWLDVLESTRQMKRHRAELRAEVDVPLGRLSVQREWTRSIDNLDRAITTPEQAGVPQWAASAGVAPRRFTMVAALRPVASVYGSMIYARSARTPLDTRSGLDPQGTALYDDRGGAQRNTGRAPPRRTLDVNLFRRFSVPFSLGGQGTSVLASLTGENVLSAANYDQLAITTASPFHGRPLSASPGRSLRLALQVVR